MPENPDQVVEIGEVMRRFVQIQEWMLLAHLLENEKLAQTIAMVVDPATTKDFVAGFVAGMECAINLPNHLIAQANQVVEIQKAQEKARYEAGGQSEVSM